MPSDFTPYTNHFLLPNYTQEHQQKLSSAKVTIIGAGGLGIPVLQYVLAMGVGSVTIIDGDQVMIKNLNRQVIYRPSDEGEYKTKVIQQLYPDEINSGRLHTVPTFLTKSTIAELLNQTHFVVDATDNYDTRYLLDDYCSEHAIPWVYGAIHQFEAQVTVFNLGDKENAIRYCDLYPENKLGNTFSCQSEGVVGSVTGVVGAIQANELFMLITGYGSSLHGNLLHINLKSYQTRKIRIPKRMTTVNSPDLASPAENELEISLTKFKDVYKDASLIIDLRSEYLFSKSKLAGAIRVEPSKLHAFAKYLDTSKAVLLYCEKGMLSKHLASELRSLNSNLPFYSLSGGYSF